MCLMFTLTLQSFENITILFNSQINLKNSKDFRFKLQQHKED
jgi:hypothetical protein